MECRGGGSFVTHNKLTSRRCSFQVLNFVDLNNGLKVYHCIKTTWGETFSCG